MTCLRVACRAGRPEATIPHLSFWYETPQRPWHGTIQGSHSLRIFFARRRGFQNRQCILEHPLSNSIAKSFIGVPVKVKDKKRLFNYRNTPHPSNVKAPAELMLARQKKTRLNMPTKEKINKEVKPVEWTRTPGIRESQLQQEQAFKRLR